MARRDGTFVSDEVTQTYGGASSIVFELVSGRTGTTLSFFTSAEPPSIEPTADATTVPDLSGDGLDDVVVVAPHPFQDEGQWTITAYSGRGGLPEWQTEIRTSDYPFVRGLTLDGDELGDVLVQSADLEHEPEKVGPTRLEALSGRDGSSLWAANFRGYTESLAAGDATKGGGQDLLVFAHASEDQAKGGSTGALLRGSDGRTLWSRTLRSPQYAADATGDGVKDVLARNLIGRGTSARYETDLVSGATGKRVWTRQGPRTEWIGPLGGDLDGDRAGDLAGCRAAKDTQTYVAIDGRTGRDLWGQPVTSKGYLVLLDTATLRHRGKADVLESFGSGEGQRSIVTGARSGQDGTRLWQRALHLPQDGRRPFPERG